MLQDTKKFLSRTFKPIKFLNVEYPEDYIALEKEHKELRKYIDTISEMVETYLYYEYGGKINKNMDKLANKIASTTHLNSLVTNTLYNSPVVLGNKINSVVNDKELKETSKQMSEIFSGILSAKETMNNMLLDLKNKIAKIKKSSLKIKELRDAAKNKRYDVESHIQSSEYSESIKNSLMSEFVKSVDSATIEMENFKGENGVLGVMNDFISINKSFMSTSQVLF